MNDIAARKIEKIIIGVMQQRYPSAGFDRDIRADFRAMAKAIALSHLQKDADSRQLLAEIKQIALTVKPADVPAGLAHIVRLCIDGGARSLSHIHDERQASSPLSSKD